MKDMHELTNEEVNAEYEAAHALIALREEDRVDIELEEIEEEHEAFLTSELFICSEEEEIEEVYIR